MAQARDPNLLDRSSPYRAVWRWHFYAGLIVLPFLLWLAVTGSLYLYKPEIESLVYGQWDKAPAGSGRMPLDRLVASVERQSASKVVQIVRPRDQGSSWRMTLSDPEGGRKLAFVDPLDGRLLGVTSDGGIMQTIRNLHSLIITGPIGNAVIEAVAGWAIILALSGLYLWWPRGFSPAIGLRGRPSGRLFWRDLHASAGALAAALILFLALTGMPWTGFWGKQLQSSLASHGLGRPQSTGPSPWQAAKDHGDHDKAREESLPWSLQAAVAPAADDMGDVGPARIAKIARARGLDGGWTMTLPSAPHQPYLVSATIVRAGDARALYVDRSGRILQDNLYAGFGAGARTIEWGIATHQGQQYGEANRLLMLAGCIAIALLALTAPFLWWKRRRDGRLAAPPRATDRKQARQVLAIMIGIGALFPMTGLSMVAALLVDMLWRRFGRAAPALP